MGLLQALFSGGQGQPQSMQGLDTSALSGRIQEMLGAKQPAQSPVADILSQRFAATPSDTYSAIIKSAPINSPIMTGGDVAASRGAGMLELMSKISSMQDMQIKMQQLQETTRHDYATEAQNPNAQPIGASPVTPSAGGGPLVRPLGMPIQQPAQMQQPQTGALPPSAQTALARDVFNNPGPKRGDPDYNPALDGPQQQQPMQNANAGLTPLFKGNEPYKDGLPTGFQWAQAQDGSYKAMQIPGTIEKGPGGEVLKVEPNTGEVTQHIPPNPEAKAKLEKGLAAIAKKFDELKAVNGTVEQGGDWVDNLHNTVMGSGYGQSVGRIGGGKAQEIRDSISSIVKQQVLPLMQAIGATPGMERAFQAQKQLLESLGGSTTMMRQSVMDSLKNISEQSGTGALSKMLNPAQMQQPQGGGMQGRISIVTPDGRPGTVDAAHVQDLLNAGGKLAQ